MIARLNVGGPAQHVVHLTALLAERFPTRLVAGHVADGEADMTAFARARGVEVHTIPELGRRLRPWHDAVALLRLYRLMRGARPAVVHTHTAKAGTLGRIAAVAARVPVRVHTFHGHVFRGYFGPFGSRLAVLVERALARFTTCIVTLSESQALELTEEFRICDRDRVAVIPLGLDLERFAPHRLASLAGRFRGEIDAGDARIVTIVGRLARIKNHRRFLRLAAALRAAGAPDAVFAVVGGGEEEPALTAYARELGIAERVRFVGWRAELEPVYADSDVVVLTSDNEGTPVCLIEALAAGCPVVATDVGGVSDVLEGGRLGAVVAPADETALVRAVKEVLSAERGARAETDASRERVLFRYGRERLAQDMEGLYGRLLAGTISKATSSSNASEHSCTT